MYLYLHKKNNTYTVDDGRRIDSANDKMASISLLYSITEQHTSAQPQKSQLDFTQSPIIFRFNLDLIFKGIRSLNSRKPGSSVYSQKRWRLLWSGLRYQKLIMA